MKKKKVLLVSQPTSGGVGKHVAQLLEHLDKDKFDLTLIHGPEEDDSALAKVRNKINGKTELIECPWLQREINFNNEIKAIRFIHNWIKNNQPDVVHAHSSKAGLSARVAAKLAGTEKVFYTPHAYAFMAPEFSPTKKKVFQTIERLLSQTATTKTFTVSNGEREQALNAKLDKPHKFQTIYNGIPAEAPMTREEARDALGLPQDLTIIGNNARLSDQKNPLLFLEVAKAITEKHPYVRFVWVGDGPLRETCERFISENGLTDKVLLYGYRDDTEAIVAAYDVFLLTSRYEGLPYAPIEAMRAGVPIVATDVVGNRELVNSNLCGETPEELSYRLCDYLRCGPVSSKEDETKKFELNFSIDSMISSLSINY
jgi:glycosyltransferase involved in cell wall biosynthesis